MFITESSSSLVFLFEIYCYEHNHSKINQLKKKVKKTPAINIGEKIKEIIFYQLRDKKSLNNLARKQTTDIKKKKSHFLWKIIKIRE